MPTHRLYESELLNLLLDLAQLSEFSIQETMSTILSPDPDSPRYFV